MLCLLWLRSVAVERVNLTPLHGRRSRTHVHHLRKFLGKIRHRFSGASIISDLIKRWNIREGKRERGVAQEWSVWQRVHCLRRGQVRNLLQAPWRVRSKTNYKNTKGLGRTVSNILGFEPCSSGHDREVVSREGLYPVGHSLGVHQPMYSVCCWGLMAGSRLADRLVSVLGVKRSLGGESQ